MILPIVSLSALEFWMSDFFRKHSKVYLLNEQQLQHLPLKFRLISEKTMIRELANSYGLSLPLQIMAENDRGSCFCKLPGALLCSDCTGAIASPSYRGWE